MWMKAGRLYTSGSMVKNVIPLNVGSFSVSFICLAYHSRTLSPVIMPVSGCAAEDALVTSLHLRDMGPLA